LRHIVESPKLAPDSPLKNRKTFVVSAGARVL
jgi:hypothetical protein